MSNPFPKIIESNGLCYSDMVKLNELFQKANKIQKSNVVGFLWRNRVSGHEAKVIQTYGSYGTQKDKLGGREALKPKFKAFH